MSPAPTAGRPAPSASTSATPATSAYPSPLSPTLYHELSGLVYAASHLAYHLTSVGRPGFPQRHTEDPPRDPQQTVGRPKQPLQPAPLVVICWTGTWYRRLLWDPASRRWRSICGWHPPASWRPIYWMKEADMNEHLPWPEDAWHREVKRKEKPTPTSPSGHPKVEYVRRSDSLVHTPSRIKRAGTRGGSVR